jgi:hypothetical protein
MKQTTRLIHDLPTLQIYINRFKASDHESQVHQSDAPTLPQQEGYTSGFCPTFLQQQSYQSLPKMQYMSLDSLRFLQFSGEAILFFECSEPRKYFSTELFLFPVPISVLRTKDRQFCLEGGVNGEDVSCRFGHVGFELVESLDAGFKTC